MAFALSDLTLNSPDFQAGTRIPDVHARESGNVSPALRWKNVPAGTRSLAIFVHDPDAPLISTTGNYGFVHWLLYNIPVDCVGLEQGSTEFAKGMNDFGETGYGGPRPPAGHGRHHYYFWILALDVEPMLQDNLELWEFLEKAEPRVLGMNRLVGYYETP